MPRFLLPIADAAAASATKLRLKTNTPSGNRIATPSSHSTVETISPVNARAGNSHHTCGSIFSPAIIVVIWSWLMPPVPRELRLNSWNDRNTVAPATALMICASTRVLRGPISRNNPVTMSSARPVAAKASVASTTIAESHSGDEKIAIQISGGPSIPA